MTPITPVRLTTKDKEHIAYIRKHMPSKAPSTTAAIQLALQMLADDIAQTLAARNLKQGW